SLTSTVSPASTPASWRTARFRPSRNSPRIRVTVVRQVKPLTVATTGKRLAPSPTTATCSSSSTTAAAGPRGTSVAVNRTEPTRRFSQGDLLLVLRSDPLGDGGRLSHRGGGEELNHDRQAAVAAQRALEA